MTDKSPETFVTRVAREFTEAKGLATSKPLLFALLAVLGLVVLYVAYRYYWDIPSLKRKIEQLTHEKEQLRTELEAERHKYSSLELQFNPFKTAAILKYGSDGAAIAKLAEDLKRIDSDLRKIKYLAVLVQVEYTSVWRDGKIPDPTHWLHTGGGNGEVEIAAELKDGRKIVIPFGPSDSLKIEPLVSSYVRLSYRANATAGSAIFGEIPENIAKIAQFKLPVYGSQREYCSVHLRFRSINIRFFVNGTAYFATHADANQDLPVSEQGYSSLSSVMPLPVEFIKIETAAGE